MIVLLVISTVIAIIAPQPGDRLRERTADTTAQEPIEPEDPGWGAPAAENDLHSVVDTESNEGPGRISARVGDRLRLEVRGGSGRLVEIPEMGLVETQSRTAPASFDLYFDRPGDYRVVDAETGRPLAEIVVEAGERSEGASSASEQPVASPRAVRA